jgi:hypothetical protein
MREAVLEVGNEIDFFDDEEIEWKNGVITHLDIDHNLNTIFSAKSTEKSPLMEQNK